MELRARNISRNMQHALSHEVLGLGTECQPDLVYEIYLNNRKKQTKDSEIFFCVGCASQGPTEVPDRRYIQSTARRCRSRGQRLHALFAPAAEKRLLLGFWLAATPLGPGNLILVLMDLRSKMLQQRVQIRVIAAHPEVAVSALGGSQHDSLVGLQLDLN